MLQLGAIVQVRWKDFVIDVGGVAKLGGPIQLCSVSHCRFLIGIESLNTMLSIDYVDSSPIEHTLCDSIKGACLLM